MGFSEESETAARASSSGTDNDDLTGTLLRRIDELTDSVVARDTFIAVAAHELRNPMMPIIGQLDLLLSAVRAGRYTLDQVGEKLDRLQQTVQAYVKRAVILLDVSRINAGKFSLDPVPCDLACLVRNIADEFAATAQHAGATIEVDAPVSLPGLWDRLAIEQIVDNLLSNAIKYGGRTPVHLCLVDAPDHIRIHVRDHGRGIPPEHRRRVFERFERAVGRDEYRSGFGVGLWIVGQLVDAMRGSIVVDDAAGGGAVFIVSLPKHGTPAA